MILVCLSLPSEMAVWKAHPWGGSQAAGMEGTQDRRNQNIPFPLFIYLFISPSNHFNCSLTVTTQCQQINLCSKMLQIPHGDTRWILAPRDEMVWLIRCHESLYAVCRISLYTATTRKLAQTVQPVEKKTISFYPEQREITKYEGRESRGCRDALEMPGWESQGFGLNVHLRTSSDCSTEKKVWQWLLGRV